MDGVQQWTVPETGAYRIEACGASGGEGTYESGVHPVSPGGRGACVKGEFSLQVGTVLNILVGQMGTTDSVYEHQPLGAVAEVHSS